MSLQAFQKFLASIPEPQEELVSLPDSRRDSNLLEVVSHIVLMLPVLSHSFIIAPQVCPRAVCLAASPEAAIASTLLQAWPASK